jgi:hypothetical protein
MSEAPRASATPINMELVAKLKPIWFKEKVIPIQVKSHVSCIILRAKTKKSIYLFMQISWQIPLILLIFFAFVFISAFFFDIS